MSGNRNLPNFMGRYFVNEQSHWDAREQARLRLQRGLCPRDGRPMAVEAIDASAAALVCKACGERAIVNRGSRGYRSAKVLVELEPTTKTGRRTA